MSSVRIVAVVGNPRPQSRMHRLARALTLELAGRLPMPAEGGPASAVPHAR